MHHPEIRRVQAEPDMVYIMTLHKPFSFRFLYRTSFFDPHACHDMWEFPFFCSVWRGLDDDGGDLGGESTVCGDFHSSVIIQYIYSGSLQPENSTARVPRRRCIVDGVDGKSPVFKCRMIDRIIQTALLKIMPPGKEVTHSTLASHKLHHEHGKHDANAAKKFLLQLNGPTTCLRTPLSLHPCIPHSRPFRQQSKKCATPFDPKTPSREPRGE